MRTIPLVLLALLLLACSRDGPPAPPHGGQPEGNGAPPAAAQPAPDGLAAPVPVVPLDTRLPEPLPGAQAPLDIPPPVTLGNLFDTVGQPRPVTVRPLLREQETADGKHRIVIDGAQLSVEKPVH